MRPIPLLPDGVLRIAARAGVTFVVLACAWFAVREQWAVAFRAAGNLVLLAAGAAGTFEFLSPPLSVGRTTPDVMVRVLDGDLAHPTVLLLSSFRFGYVPYAVCFSLGLSQGGSRRAMVRRASLAVLAATLYVILSLWLGLSRSVFKDGVTSPPLRTIAIELAYRVFVNPPGAEYAVPGFLCLLAMALREVHRRPVQGAGTSP